MQIIKNFIVTGDIHGNINPIRHFCNDYNTDENALIILGDVGFNFYLNKTDKKIKEQVQRLNCLVYCVRGNHEERPENLEDIIEVFDKTIQGNVWIQEDWPNIRYLIDGNIYYFNDYKVLILGGAYSVDKDYRLQQAINKGLDPTEHWCGWFKDEQLTQDEMDYISDKVDGQEFDFIFSHTCPYDWQPFDLFLNAINQSKVDNSMEKWMQQLKSTIKWKYAWLFGHFHDDRIVRPHVEMFYNDFESLDNIAKRWTEWDQGYKLDWWLNFDPTWPFWNEEMDKRKDKINWFTQGE